MYGSEVRRMVIVAVATTVVLAGCARRDPIELPELSVVNLRLADVTLFETVAEFEIRITNAGPTPLSLDGGAMAIFLEGIKVGKGVIAGPLQISAFDSTTVRLPVYISNLSLATRLRPVLSSGRVSYRVKGVLFEQGGLGLRRLRTSRAGSFDFRLPDESLAPSVPQDPSDR